MKRETEGEDDILVMVEFHLSTQLRHRPGLGDMAMEKTHLTPNTKPQGTSNNTKDTNLIIWHTSTQPTLFFKPSNAVPPISSASHLILSYIMCLLATSAVNTGAAITTLAALVLGCWNLHERNPTAMARGQYRLSLLLASFLLVAVASDALIGGWSPIEDVKNPHVQEIGKFAVEAHNKLTATKLKFQSVIKGQTQVVAGTNYRLTVMAKNGAASKKYEAVVWEKLDGTKQLTSFQPV